MGSWGGHVKSWLDESGLPVHLVRYEDLRRDAEATFSAMVRFCGLPYTMARVRKAVAFSDFGNYSARSRKRVSAKDRLKRPPSSVVGGQTPGVKNYRWNWQNV